MFKTFKVKNPDLRDEMKNKWITRVESDGTIAKNRFVEKDPSSGNIEVAGLASLRVIGALQDKAVANLDFFDCELGPVYVTAGSPLVAGQKVKVGTGGKAVALIDALLKDVEIATFDGAVFTNQPATDGITVVSDSALDITQTVSVYGIDAAGAFITEDFLLTGTVDVVSAAVDWAIVCGVIIDDVTEGDIEISETSGGLEIVTVSAGDVEAGIEDITDGYAYNAKPTVVADGGSTGKILFYHEATDGASLTTVIVTTNGTAEVAFGVDSYKVTRAMTGGLAAVNIDLDVTGTEDSYQYCVGRVLVGADEGDTAVINMFG